MSTAMRAPLSVLFSVVLFSTLLFAPLFVRAVDSDADKQCPAETAKQDYKRHDIIYPNTYKEKRGTQTITVTSLYHKECDDSTSGKLSVKGKCEAANVCGGKKCLTPSGSFEDCKKTDVKVDTSKNTPVKLEPLTTEAVRKALEGGLPPAPETQIVPGTNKSLMEQLLNPTPLSEQKTELSPSARSVGELFKQVDANPGVSGTQQEQSQTRELFSPTPLNPNGESFQLQPRDESGNLIPQTVGPQNTITNPNGTFGQTQPVAQSEPGWLASKWEAFKSFFSPSETPRVETPAAAEVPAKQSEPVVNPPLPQPRPQEAPQTDVFTYGPDDAKAYTTPEYAKEIRQQVADQQRTVLEARAATDLQLQYVQRAREDLDAAATAAGATVTGNKYDIPTSATAEQRAALGEAIQGYNDTVANAKDAVGALNKGVADINDTINRYKELPPETLVADRFEQAAQKSLERVAAYELARQQITSNTGWGTGLSLDCPGICRTVTEGGITMPLSQYNSNLDQLIAAEKVSAAQATQLAQFFGSNDPLAAQSAPSILDGDTRGQIVIKNINDMLDARAQISTQSPSVGLDQFPSEYDQFAQSRAAERLAAEKQSAIERLTSGGQLTTAERIAIYPSTLPTEAIDTQLKRERLASSNLSSVLHSFVPIYDAISLTNSPTPAQWQQLAGMTDSQITDARVSAWSKAAAFGALDVVTFAGFTPVGGKVIGAVADVVVPEFVSSAASRIAGATWAGFETVAPGTANVFREWAANGGIDSATLSAANLSGDFKPAFVSDLDTFGTRAVNPYVSQEQATFAESVARGVAPDVAEAKAYSDLYQNLARSDLAATARGNDILSSLEREMSAKGIEPPLIVRNTSPVVAEVGTEPLATNRSLTVANTQPIEVAPVATIVSPPIVPSISEAGIAPVAEPVVSAATAPAFTPTTQQIAEITRPLVEATKPATVVETQAISEYNRALDFYSQTQARIESGVLKENTPLFNSARDQMLAASRALEENGLMTRVAPAELDTRGADAIYRAGSGEVLAERPTSYGIAAAEEEYKIIASVSPSPTIPVTSSPLPDITPPLSGVPVIPVTKSPLPDIFASGPDVVAARSSFVEPPSTIVLDRPFKDALSDLFNPSKLPIAESKPFITLDQKGVIDLYSATEGALADLHTKGVSVTTPLYSSYRDQLTTAIADLRAAGLRVDGETGAIYSGDTVVAVQKPVVFPGESPYVVVAPISEGERIASIPETATPEAFVPENNIPTSSWNPFETAPNLLRAVVCATCLVSPVSPFISGAEARAVALAERDFQAPISVVSIPEVKFSSTYGYGNGSGDSATQALAGGGRLNEYPWTIADNTSPLGTRYQVTNPKTGKSVIAEVRDRGPYIIVNGVPTPHPSRKVDVSKAVAEAIGMGRTTQNLVYKPVPQTTTLGPSGQNAVAQAVPKTAPAPANIEVPLPRPRVEPTVVVAAPASKAAPVLETATNVQTLPPNQTSLDEINSQIESLHQKVAAQLKVAPPDALKKLAERNAELGSTLPSVQAVKNELARAAQEVADTSLRSERLYDAGNTAGSKAEGAKVKPLLDALIAKANGLTNTSLASSDVAAIRAAAARAQASANVLENTIENAVSIYFSKDAKGVSRFADQAAFVKYVKGLAANFRTSVRGVSAPLDAKIKGLQTEIAANDKIIRQAQQLQVAKTNAERIGAEYALKQLEEQKALAAIKEAEALAAAKLEEERVTTAAIQETPTAETPTQVVERGIEQPTYVAPITVVYEYLNIGKGLLAVAKDAVVEKIASLTSVAPSAPAPTQLQQTVRAGGSTPQGVPFGAPQTLSAYTPPAPFSTSQAFNAALRPREPKVQSGAAGAQPSSPPSPQPLPPAPSAEQILANRETYLKNPVTTTDAFRDFPRLPLQGLDAEIQEASIAQYLSQKNAMLNDYIAHFGHKVVNPDLAYLLFRPIGYEGSNVAAVQKASSALAQDVWRDALANNPESQVVLLAGGSGAGKSTTVRNVLPEIEPQAAAIVDGTSANALDTKQKIEEIIAAGKTPEIVYVYREPIDAWEHGMISRMNGTSLDSGRIVPVSIFASTHKRSWQVVKELLDDNRVHVSLIDNSRGAGNAVLMTPEEFNAIKYPSNSQLNKALVAKTDELLDKGVINAQQYAAITGAEAPTKLALAVAEPVTTVEVEVSAATRQVVDETRFGQALERVVQDLNIANRFNELAADFRAITASRATPLEVVTPEIGAPGALEPAATFEPIPPLENTLAANSIPPFITAMNNGLVNGWNAAKNFVARLRTSSVAVTPAPQVNLDAVVDSTPYARTPQQEVQDLIRGLRGTFADPTNAAVPAIETAPVVQAPPTSVSGTVTGALDTRTPIRATVNAAPVPIERKTVVLADEPQIENPVSAPVSVPEGYSDWYKQVAEQDAISGHQPFRTPGPTPVANMVPVIPQKQVVPTSAPSPVVVPTPVELPAPVAPAPVVTSAPTEISRSQLEVLAGRALTDAEAAELGYTGNSALPEAISKEQLEVLTGTKFTDAEFNALIGQNSLPVATAVTPSWVTRISNWFSGRTTPAVTPTTPTTGGGGGTTPPTVPPTGGGGGGGSGSDNQSGKGSSWFSARNLWIGTGALVVGLPIVHFLAKDGSGDAVPPGEEKKPPKKPTVVTPAPEKDKPPVPPTTRKGQPCGPNDTYASSGCYPPYVAPGTRGPNGTNNPTGQILDKDYYCVTSITPVVVKTVPAGTPFPNNCYNKPGDGSSPSSLGNALGQLLGKMFGTSAPASTPTTATTASPVTPPTATSTVAKPLATLVVQPTTILSGKTSKLIWSSINTSACELFAPDNMTMATGTRGSTSTLSLATTTQFTLNCSAPSGATTSAQATVTVQ